MKRISMFWAVACLILLSPHIGAAPGDSTGSPSSITGTIATNRLGDVQSAFLRSPSYAKGSVKGVERELTPGVASGLSDALLSDKTWVGRRNLYNPETQSSSFHPTVTFLIGSKPEIRSGPFMEINIDPVSQYLSTIAWGFAVSHGYEQFTSYAVNAPQITALLKKAFPKDADIQALTADHSPASVPENPVPADIRTRIATLHTGMTRADLLKLFQTEGGISNRFQRSYIYCGESVTAPDGTEIKAKAKEIKTNGSDPQKPSTFSGYVKINAEFMPRNAHLKWIDGVGTLIDPAKIYKFDGVSEQPDDVIVRLSMPYLGFEVMD